MTEEVTFDIETENMSLHPWQQKIMNTIMTSGIKRGELFTMTSGRQTGKSQFTAQTIKRLMDDLNRQPVSDLILSEGTVYGARYHCVEPVGGNWMDMEVWCLDTFGSCGQNMWGDGRKAPEPAQRWYMNNRKFWFRSEKDRDWFILRWNS